MRTTRHSLGTLVETDVLVIGSGASGCGAALGARDQGQDVVIIDKGKLESSGCIGGGNDHYMAVLDEPGESFDTADDLVKFYAKPLNGWTRNMLVNGWYNHMRHFLDILGAAGVDFGRTDDGAYVRTQGFGQPGRWWVHIANGMTIKRVMARLVHESGVHVLDRIMAMRILTDHGKACGCLGWNVRTGEYVIIRAKTVVSAQGRSATRGTDNSTHNAYNVWMYPYNTSAGVVLGYQAGAAVTELDTYQRATLLPKGFGCPGMNGINSSGAHELNALGERFMGKYDPMGENGVRNNQIQGTFQEQMEGSGPPFYMDMRHVDPAVVQELQYVLMPGDKATFGDWADCTGTDFQRKLLEVEIGELIFGGAIAVNDNFESSVPNLFSGSVFLYCSGAMCGGYEAGRQAAMRAAGMTEAGQVDEDMAREVRDEVFAPMTGPASDPVGYAELEQATRNVMNYYMGFRRSVAGMERALEKIRFLSGQARRLHAVSLRELMRCHESRDILTVCELAIQATLERKESGRCVYRVREFPELNPEMAKPLLLIREKDGPRFQWGKAPLL
ncbi:FAD-binding protein [uncultured Desulfovibrio sp.]|uniref:FAD-binding protein n=2 Tax=uncultured Desulfovibrio sp. TaxID=167968 RepID=UPI00260400C1|nr:FAD-binding protein [uncultured Desulfovibrio sp.]